ncbi:MAG TPA: hypothetical protein VIL37_18625 [Natronosporangium sp.]
MSWKFNPPPGWPAQPEGWVPPPGWAPDPSWPPPPPGWQFWVPAGSSPAPAPTSPPAAPPPAAAPAPPPAAPPGGGAAGFGTTPAPPFSSGAPPFGAGGSAPQGSPFGAPGGPPPPYGAATQAKPSRPWFGQWWGILGLIAALVVGVAVGYGVTRAALNAADDSDNNASGPLDPGASQTPVAPIESQPAGPAELPSGPPLQAPPLGSEVCLEVGVIMLNMATAPLEETDPDVYYDTVIESRRTAADQIRQLEGVDAAQQEGLETLADEIDAAASMVEDDRDNFDTVQASYDRVDEAYDTFTADHCT